MNNSNGKTVESHRGGSRNEIPSDHIPLVSVITVCYNAANTLAKTIISVRDQHFSNYEFIVVDGASTDQTNEILTSLDSDIDHWISEPDGGIFDAMNKGTHLAKGEYLAFLNADDRYLPDTLIHLSEAVKFYEAAVYHGNMIKERVIDGKIYQREEKPNPGFMPKGMGIFHPCSFVKREEFLVLGGFNTRYKLAADYDLFLRLWQKGVVFHHIDRPLAVFTLGGASNTGCGTYAEAVEIQRLNKTGTATKTRLLLWKCRLKNIGRKFVFAAAGITGRQDSLNKKIAGKWQ